MRLTNFLNLFHLASHQLPSLTPPFPAISSTPFISKLVTSVVPLAILLCGSAFIDILFSGMSLDFSKGLITYTSFEDSFPCLLPEVAINLEAPWFAEGVPSFGSVPFRFVLQVFFRCLDES